MNLQNKSRHLAINLEELPKSLSELPKEEKYPFKDIPALIDLLKAKGMLIDDEQLAVHYLKYVGYSRLQTYWLVFQKDQKNLQGKTRSSNPFLSGTRIEHVIALSEFDKKLRLLFLEAIETIELSMRVGLAYEVGRMHESGLAYLVKDQIDAPDHVFEKWLQTALKEEQRFREKDGKTIYPIWIAVSKWSFGIVQGLFHILRRDKRKHFAKSYYGVDPETLENWLQVLVSIRNVSAHHVCLWNMTFAHALDIPAKADQYERFEALEDESVSKKIYGAIVITSYLLESISEDRQTKGAWRTRMADLWMHFPKDLPHDVSPKMAGFPDDWQDTF